MHLGLNSLGQRALSLLGMERPLSAEDSPAILVVENEGPAATAPDLKEPDEPALTIEETEMPEVDMEGALAAARQEAAVAATQAANDRWKTVMNDEAATGRTKLAISLLGTSLSAEEVIAQLQVAAVEAAPAATTTPLERRMAAEPNPQVTADPVGAAASNNVVLADRMRARFAKKGN